MSIASRVESAAKGLAKEVDGLRFAAPVDRVYNPLVYAWVAHASYLRRYATTTKQVVLLGMNPGPFGMAQTGVPFGDVAMARDWLGIEVAVAGPPDQHPKRPITGFACSRREVSGSRLWGAVAAHHGEPDAFFAAHFVANYCPLVFLESSGRNRTPDKLPVDERALLFAACDRHLRALVQVLRPRWVIGVGRFAEQRASAALFDLDVRVGQILHPSPASPRANRDWVGAVRAQLDALGVARFL